MATSPSAVVDRVDPDSAPLLLMAGISKRFQGVQALDAASLSLRSGQVHALLGGNGAGKSTLLNVLSGMVSPDAGTITLAGSPVRFAHPSQAQAAGITTIHQELSTVPDLTVLENILLGRESQITGAVSPLLTRRAAARRVASLAEEFGISSRELWTPVGEFGALKKRVVEIVKALAVEPRILILDEPTSGLEEHEKQLLFGHMRTLQKRGVALVWVTHHLDEIFGLADRVTVMRDGRTVISTDIKDLDRAALLGFMFGSEAAELLESDGAQASTATGLAPSGESAVQAASGPAVAVDSDDADGSVSTFPRLSVRDLARPGVLRGISFDASAGEILGIAGLAGAGRTELVRAVMGLDRITGGQVLVDGRPLHLRDPRAAYRAGMAMVPEDRKQLGILADLSVAENISLSRLGSVGSSGVVSRRRERALALRYIEQLGIKTPGPGEKIRNLSGGNQQKAVIARCLNTNPSIVIFDEPTQGIDVHAKAEVHRLVRELAAAGTTVLVIASEFAELATLCHRVMVLNRGRLVGEFSDLPQRLAREGLDKVQTQIMDRASRADR